MPTSEALIQSTTRHAVYLERLKSGEVLQFEKFLRKIDRQIRFRLAGEILTDFSRTRLERLLVKVNRDLKTIFNEHEDVLSTRLIDTGFYEAQFEARNLQNAIVGFESVIPSDSQIRASILSTPLSVRGIDGGKLLQPFIKDWSNNEIKRVTGSIRQGFFEGQTTGQILQKVRGTRANGYRDGVLAITNRNAEAVVRTAVQHVATTARFETWKENSKVVAGYRIVATLDSKTSTICRSMDGRIFKEGKGPRPPFHIRCRTTTVAELDEDFDFLKEGRTRSSRNPNGKVQPVDADVTYYDWLKRQSRGFQNDILGPKRAKLLRDGGLSANRFSQLNLDRDFKPLTLEQMRQKEPLAFERANL